MRVRAPVILSAAKEGDIDVLQSAAKEGDIDVILSAAKDLRPRFL